VLSIDEALHQEQVAHRELLMSLPFDDASRRNITVTRSGFTVDGVPTGVEKGPPRLDEHAFEILREIGYGEDEILQMKNEGGLQ
jgi:formyl-CoA transferase